MHCIDWAAGVLERCRHSWSGGDRQAAHNPDARDDPGHTRL